MFRKKGKHLETRMVCMQDFAALDALEADHYAKKTRGTALGVSAAQTNRAGPPQQQQQQQTYIANSVPCEHNAAGAEYRTHQGGQLAHSSAAAAEYLNSGTANQSAASLMHPATASGHGNFWRPSQQQTMSTSTQGVPWPQQQLQRVQDVQIRPAPRQSSMQSFMAAHATHRGANQAALTTVQAAGLAPTHMQQPAKLVHATGVLAADMDDCIDLTSQPEAHVAEPEHRQQPAQSLQSMQQPQAAAPEVITHQQQPQQQQQDTDERPEEDFEDDKPEELLMECSSNLLNPGIRVHKYSIAFLLHVGSSAVTYPVYCVSLIAFAGSACG